jgi:DNA repair protein RecO (recombination protein O)
MQVATKAIVLRTVKYGETSLIVQMFTEALGKISLMFKGVRQKNKKGSSKAGLLVAGNLLNIELRYQEQKHWQIATYVEAHPISLNVKSLLQNSCIEIITEVLDNCIQTSEAQEEVFACAQDAIELCMSYSDHLCKIQPLLFCITLCKHLGFTIQGQASVATPYLNLHSGNFEQQIVHGSTSEDAEKVSALIHQLNCGQIDFALENFDSQTRAQALDAMINYLAIHIGHNLRINSLAIWRKVLS